MLFFCADFMMMLDIVKLFVKNMTACMIELVHL